VSGKSKYLGELTYRQMEILRRMAAGDRLRSFVEYPLQLYVGSHDPPVITNHVVRKALEREGLIERAHEAIIEPAWEISDAGLDRVEAWDQRLEKHWRAKFTDDQVREIRARHSRWQKMKAKHQVTLTGLAAEYGVSTSCIGNMLAGDTYKDVK
jgi:hypothetical protein